MRSKCVLSISYQVDSIGDDSRRFRAAAKWIAQQYQLTHMEVSLAVVDDKTIHELNREHLDHDWPTDVISFLFESDGSYVDGEVIASADTARRLSEVAGWPPTDELLLYVVHGLLHLAGLDDVQPDDRRVMRQAELDCLTALQVENAREILEHFDRVSY